MSTERSLDRPADPIAVGITRHVKSNQVDEFEAWLREIQMTAATFAGFNSMDIVRPGPARPLVYVVILRFDRYEHYQTWHESHERSELVKRSLVMTIGHPAFEESHGLEAWFTPGTPEPSVPPPARYKMTVLTIAGLYPLIAGVGLLIGAATDLATTISTLLTVIVVAALATYVVMPWITRAARRWLYPPPIAA